MLTNEYRILELFAKSVWSRYSFTDLMKLLKIKSRSYLASVLKKFVDDSILKRELIGRLPIYSLNTLYSKAILSAGFALEYSGWNKKNIPYKDIEKVMTKLSTKNFVLMITGSYVKNKQTESSDLDMVILVDDASDVKKHYAEISFICEMNIPQIHLYIFRNKEFLEMLLNNEANYGKEIVQNNLIITGGQNYLRLLDEAMKHGFTNNLTY